MSYLLIPLNGDDVQNAITCAIDKCKHFAQVEIDESNTIVEINFHDSYEPLLGVCEYMVVDKQEQNFEDFDDYEMGLLLCAPKSNIDDIVEGYIFRSLHEI